MIKILADVAVMKAKEGSLGLSGQSLLYGWLVTHTAEKPFKPTPSELLHALLECPLDMGSAVPKNKS